MLDLPPQLRNVCDKDLPNGAARSPICTLRVHVLCGLRPNSSGRPCAPIAW